MSSWTRGKIPKKKINENIFVLNQNTPNYFSCICAIALNEEKYIDEWIKYNLLLGFEHIFIYDNSEDNSLKSKVSDFVSIIHFPGKTKQLEAYNNFISTYKNNCTWTAFIDIDEFIVLKKHKSINEFIEDYKTNSGIALNWLIFGTSNHTSYSNEPVTSRFRYCSKTTNSCVKSICKLSDIDKFTITPHVPKLIKGSVYSTNKFPVFENEPFNYSNSSDIACIHHYFTKSEQEFAEKINRGRSDTPEKYSLNELIDIHSKNNDVYNTDAWDFFSNHL